MLCSSFVLKTNLWSISIHFADLDTLICKENDWFPTESTREGPWTMRNDHGLITNDNGPSENIFARHERDYHKIGTKDIGKQVVLLGSFHLNVNPRLAGSYMELDNLSSLWEHVEFNDHWSLSSPTDHILQNFKSWNDQIAKPTSKGNKLFPSWDTLCWVKPNEGKGMNYEWGKCKTYVISDLILSLWILQIKVSKFSFEIISKFLYMWMLKLHAMSFCFTLMT